MLKVVLCDNSSEYIVWIKNELICLMNNHGYDLEIAKTADKPSDLIQFATSNEETIIYIMNTFYPDGASGIELAKKIREFDRESYVVFITENDQSIHDVFNGLIRPAGFYVKPISREDFQVLMADIYRDYLNCYGMATILNINIGAQMYRLEYSQIYYLESFQKKVYVHTLNQRIGYYDSLQSLEKRLGNSFMRCHKSYLINIEKISMVDYAKNKVVLQNGDEIDISRSYKNEVKSKLGSYIPKKVE